MAPQPPSRDQAIMATALARAMRREAVRQRQRAADALKAARRHWRLLGTEGRRPTGQG
jgi:hypothetical protein